MVLIFFLLKGNTELPRNPKQKIVSVDFLTFVTYSVLLSLCFWFYFWYNRKRKVTVIEIQLKKKTKKKKKRAHINITMVEC